MHDDKRSDYGRIFTLENKILQASRVSTTLERQKAHKGRHIYYDALVRSTAIVYRNDQHSLLCAKPKQNHKQTYL